MKQYNKSSIWQLFRSLWGLIDVTCVVICVHACVGIFTPVWVCSCLCGYIHAQAWTHACECQQTTWVEFLKHVLCLAWDSISHWPCALASRLSVHLPPSGITTTCYCAWIWKPNFINSLPMSHSVVWSRSLPTSLLPPNSTSPPMLQLWVLGFSGQRDRESMIVPHLGALIWVTSHCDTLVLYICFVNLGFFFW